MNKNLIQGLSLLLLFITPILLANYFYYYYARFPEKKTLKIHGLIPENPIKLQNETKEWIVALYSGDKCEERCQLWKQEAPKFPAVLKKYNFSFQNKSLSEIENFIPEKNVQSIMAMIDPQGYVAIYFTEENNPKKSFFDVKKLLQTTEKVQHGR